MENNELLKISQQIILNFLRKNITDESMINKIKNFLENFPISQEAETDEFLDSQNAVAEVAMSRTGKRMMLIRTNAKLNINDIMTVIHEYAHALSGDFSPSKENLGNLKINTIFEEAMAVNFSEACINEWIKDTKMFEENMNGIIENESTYPEERTILNTILLTLNKNGLDNKAMIEYLIGDKVKFLSLCTEQLGSKFSEIFSIIEKEISAKNKNPNGYGFRNRKDIREIYDLVSERLFNIIPEETLNELSAQNDDFTNAPNRYLKTSSILKKKYFEKVLLINIINDGELSVEEGDELLKSGFFSLNREQIKQESRKIKEWTEETGYTVEQLVKYGAKSSDIEELLYKYDGKTGERLDRKLRVDEFIKKRLTVEGKTTTREEIGLAQFVGQDTSAINDTPAIVYMRAKQRKLKGLELPNNYKSNDKD